MTVREYIKSQRRKLKKATNGQDFSKVVLNVHAAQMRRIFEKGRNSGNLSIGSYNQDPIYVNPTFSPKKFNTTGKNGKTTFKNGKKKKTRYFEGGYRAFRSKVGRESSFVNLNLTGRLRTDFSTGIEKKAFNEINATIRNQANVNKMRGNEKRFGKIADLTTIERKMFNDLISNSYVKAVS